MIKSVNLAKEVIVTVVNKIGVLADISKVLAEHGINIQAVAGYSVEGSKDASIMLITDDNLRAADALRKKNYGSIKEGEVLVIELEDKSGALKSVTEKLASQNVDIRYIYGTTCTAGCPAKLVLRTSDNEKALVAFKAK